MKQPQKIDAINKSSNEIISLYYFNSDTPVSHNAAGEILSIYGDETWDMTGMSTDSTSKKTLIFYKSNKKRDDKLCELIHEQHKALVWLHMDAGKLRAWPTLRNTSLALRQCCELAFKHNTDLYSFLTNLDLISYIGSSMNKNYLDLTSAAIHTLWRNSELLKTKFISPITLIQKYLNKTSTSFKESKQTPIIPSKIYSGILANLLNDLEIIENYLDSIKSLEPNQINSKIVEYQVSLIITVIAYTGMRIGEAKILPLENVLVEFLHLDSIHYEVKGNTHKLNQGIKHNTTWVTSHEGARAIHLAKRIARLVHSKTKISPQPGQQTLLFPSINNPFKYISESRIDELLNQHRLKKCPTIDQNDIDELDNLELDRGWLRDGIEVGKSWPLCFHQLRRSLAVYAHRSGIVSLPALKAQLQHITQEMSSYYTDGFSKAVNIAFDDKHFSNEWRAYKQESSYFSYVFNVLFSEELLLGKNAQGIENTFERRNRLDTLKLFQENKLSYRETALGGCSATEPCEIDPIEPIPYECLEKNCVNQVIFIKRLDLVIKSQEIAVANLKKNEEGSVEHRLETRHLEVLMKARSYKNQNQEIN